MKAVRKTTKASSSGHVAKTAAAETGRVRALRRSGGRQSAAEDGDAALLARLEELDPASSVVRDRSAVAGIEQAVAERHAAERAVESAVRDARALGVTWTEIGAALGVSHQAAIKRYSPRT